mgnify:CR=1 FL=1
MMYLRRAGCTLRKELNLTAEACRLPPYLFCYELGMKAMGSIGSLFWQVSVGAF